MSLSSPREKVMLWRVSIASSEWKQERERERERNGRVGLEVNKDRTNKASANKS